MKPKLLFKLDYGANPLWSNDGFTRQKFGYNIDNLKDLGLSDATIELSNFVTALYWARLNPIYQGLPSFWSGEMHAFFQNKIRQLLTDILTEIGNLYDVQNKEENEINALIDRQKIDMDLNAFLNNPNDYYRKKGITFSKTEEDQKLLIDLEYAKWEKIEMEILNK